MTADEFWFLDLVVTLQWPLRVLEADNLAEKINADGHGLPHNRLVEVLLHLFQDGHLVAHDYEGDDFTPGKAAIEQGLKGYRELFFGLTAQGGARWEALARPDWSRYLDADVGCDPDELEILAGSKELIEEYLTVLPFSVDPVLGTETWDTLSPWNATYWKTLPLGHRFKSACRDIEVFLRPGGIDVDKLRRLNTWYVHPFRTPRTPGPGRY